MLPSTIPRLLLLLLLRSDDDASDADDADR